MQVGDKVKIIRLPGCFHERAQWWPESGMTGTVEAIYKNGSVRVACDQLRNQSSDSKVSKTFKKGQVRYEPV